MKHYLYYIDEAIKNNWKLPALTNYGSNTYTYGDVASNIERWHILFEKSGVVKGDKIAICAKNSAEWCIAYFAVATYGAVIVPLLPDFLPVNVVDLTKLSDSKLLIVDTPIMSGFKCNGVDVLFDGIEGFKGLVDIVNHSVVRVCSEELNDIEAVVDKEFNLLFPGGVTPKRVDYVQTNLDALAVISYTSGTSSSPKGVMLPARSISSNLSYARGNMNASPGDTILSILPLAHIFGQAFDFIFPFSKGCHIYIFTSKPVPARLLGALAEVKPFMFLTVPLLVEKIFRAKVMPMLAKPMMRVLLSIPGVRGVVYKAVRDKLITVFGGNLAQGGLLIGGAALNREVEMVMARMKFPYVIGYGMTECGPLVSYCDWHTFKPTSCGKVAHPSVDARIDSEDPENVPGEILLKGDGVTVGYYKNEKATSASYTSDGWFRTGDMGTMDKEENIYIKGRCKNMILTANGQNVYPEEIEELINPLPFILESIVVGRKHGLVALIVVNDEAVSQAGLDMDDVRKRLEKEVFALNSKLPAYSKITQCEFQDKPFEKTPKLSIKRFMYK